jgi:hypothetical protein
MSCCIVWLHPDAFPVFAEWPCEDCTLGMKPETSAQEAGPAACAASTTPCALTAPVEGALQGLWNWIATTFRIVPDRTAPDSAALS